MELAAYKVWQCKLCSEVRQDSTDMACHLHMAHGMKSLESYDRHMYCKDDCKDKEEMAEKKMKETRGFSGARFDVRWCEYSSLRGSRGSLTRVKA